MLRKAGSWSQGRHGGTLPFPRMAAELGARASNRLSNAQACEEHDTASAPQRDVGEPGHWQCTTWCVRRCPNSDVPPKTTTVSLSGLRDGGLALRTIHAPMPYPRVSGFRSTVHFNSQLDPMYLLECLCQLNGGGNVRAATFAGRPAPRQVWSSRGRRGGQPWVGRASADGLPPAELSSTPFAAGRLMQQTGLAEEPPR